MDGTPPADWYGDDEWAIDDDEKEENDNALQLRGL